MIHFQATFLEQTCDFATQVLAAAPALPSGGALDPDRMRIEMVNSRALRSGPEAQDAHAIILSLFAHKIAAPHSAGFTARKEHLMTTGQYRNLTPPSIYNTYTFTVDTFRSLTSQRTALVPTSAQIQSPTQARLEGRKRYIRVHGRVPRLSRLQARLGSFSIPSATVQIIIQTVLEESMEAAPATEWMSLWSALPDVTTREAAELVVCALEDCDQPPAPLWPA